MKLKIAAAGIFGMIFYKLTRAVVLLSAAKLTFRWAWLIVERVCEYHHFRQAVGTLRSQCAAHVFLLNITFHLLVKTPVFAHPSDGLVLEGTWYSRFGKHNDMHEAQSTGKWGQARCGDKLNSGQRPCDSAWDEAPPQQDLILPYLSVSSETCRDFIFHILITSIFQVCQVDYWIQELFWRKYNLKVE